MSGPEGVPNTRAARLEAIRKAAEEREKQQAAASAVATTPPAAAAPPPATTSDATTAAAPAATPATAPSLSSVPSTASITSSVGTPLAFAVSPALSTTSVASNDKLAALARRKEENIRKLMAKLNAADGSGQPAAGGAAATPGGLAAPPTISGLGSLSLSPSLSSSTLSPLSAITADGSTALIKRTVTGLGINTSGSSTLSAPTLGGIGGSGGGGGMSITINPPIASINDSQSSSKPSLIEPIPEREEEPLELSDIGVTDHFLSACKRGDTSLVSKYLHKGIDVDTNDNDGITACMHAARYGKTEVVRAFLGGNCDVNRRSGSGSGGYTALMRAASFGHTDCVRCLLDGLADPTLTDAHGWTALMCAAANGFDSVAGDIVQAIAKPRTVNTANATPSVAASSSGGGSINQSGVSTLGAPPMTMRGGGGPTTPMGGMMMFGGMNAGAAGMFPPPSPLGVAMAQPMFRPMLKFNTAVTSAYQAGGGGGGGLSASSSSLAVPSAASQPHFQLSSFRKGPGPSSRARQAMASTANS